MTEPADVGWAVPTDPGAHPGPSGDAADRHSPPYLAPKRGWLGTGRLRYDLRTERRRPAPRRSSLCLRLGSTRPRRTRGHVEPASSSATPLRALRLALIAFSFLALPAAAQDEPYEAETFEEFEGGFYETKIVEDAARDVLSRPEFRNLPPLDLGPGGKKADPLKSKEELRKEREIEVRRPAGSPGLLAQLFGGAVSGAVAIVLAVVVGAVVALVVLGLKRWERAEKEADKAGGDAASDDDPEPLVTPGERPADAWLAAARAAAAAGRFDEAIALLLLGAMGHAERAGLIRPRRGLTYRDYLRAVPASSPWHAALDRLIRSYAPIGFGRREATAAAFEAALAPYESALTLEPPPPSPA